MRSSINRLITLGVLLLTFSAVALAEEEWTCATLEDCINGQSCRGGTCFCATYWKPAEGTKGPCNVPDPPVCDEKTCVYKASCSVTNNTMDCQCLDGAKGDNCNTIEVDHCTVNGIKDSACTKDGVCTNLLKDFSCACNSHWAGKTCAEYSFFSVSPGKQVVFEEDFTRLNVSLLKDKPAWHSVLLLFYVENSGGTKKVTVTGNPANDELTLHVEGSDALTTSAPGLFTVGVWRSIEATFEGNDLIIKDNAVETHRMELPAGSKGTKVVFGRCDWESSGGNCGATKDDIYYNEFTGGVQSFTLDDSAKGYTSGAGGHQDLFTCADITCSAQGSSRCDASSIPHCVCKDSYGGATCADSMQASFNGYTSKIKLTHHYMGGHPTDNGGNTTLNRPVYISFNASVPVAEEIAYLAVFTGPKFEFKIVARLEDPDKTNSRLNIITDGGGPSSCSANPIHTNDPGKFVIEVTVNGAPFYCYGSVVPDAIHSDLSITLGYSDIVHHDNLQGCISNLVVDGQHVGFNNTAAIGTMVDYSQCVTDILPADPCTEEKCNERGTCAIDMINYSANCDCVAGFNGTTCEDDLSRCDLEIPCGAAENGTCKDTADAPYYECDCKTEDGYKFVATDGLEGTCVFDECYYCTLEIREGHASVCAAGVCTCVEGWKGKHCSAEAVTDKGSTQTILIIVVVALLVLMVVLISVIFTVRRCNRKNQGQGTYSPNKAELEMGATPPPKGDNIYKNSEVIENVNAESKLFEQTDAYSLHDTSYNIYNSTADVENGAKEEVVYDIADEPSPPPPPPAEEPSPPLPPAPVVEEEIALPLPPMDESPIVYETVSTLPLLYETVSTPPPANDLPEPPTPLNTTAAESPNVTMDNNVTMETGNAGVEDVKIDVGGDIEQCEDSNRLSII